MDMGKVTFDLNRGGRRLPPVPKLLQLNFFRHRKSEEVLGQEAAQRCVDL